MVDVQGAAYGQARVPGGGLDVHALERRAIQYAAVGDAVVGDPSRVAQVLRAGALGESADEVVHQLFQTLLERCGDIVVALFQRLSGRPSRAEGLHHALAEQLGHDRLTGVPGHLRPHPMVPKVVHVQFEIQPATGADHALEHIAVDRFAVRRQPHHLVLVPVLGEAEVLGHRRVIQAQGVREQHPAPDLYVAFGGRTPQHAGEVPQPVERQDGGLVVWGAVEGAGGVGDVMLYEMKLGLNLTRRGATGVGERLLN